MIESDVVQKMRVALKAQGYDVDKIADQFTVGIPDLTVSRSKRTGFLEVKLIKAFSDLPASIPLYAYIKMSPQITNMLNKEQCAFYARYIIFADGGRLCAVEPSAVVLSIRDRRRVDVLWKELESWISSMPF